MKTNDCTLRELNDLALKALVRELGPSGMVRFLRQFERGKGDYTKERHHWLENVSAKEVEAELRMRRDQRKVRPAAKPRAKRAKPA